MTSEPERNSSEYSFEHRVLIALGIILPIILLLTAVWYLVDVLLLVFASILVAIFLSSLSNLVSRWSSLPKTWSLLVVILLLLGLTGLGGWLLAPHLSEQVSKLTDNIDDSLSQIRLQLEVRSWGKALLHQLPKGQDLLSRLGQLLTKTPGILSTTLGVLGSLFLVAIVGIYLAAHPRPYLDGLIRLFPIPRRPRVREIMHEISDILRWWLIGRISSMFIIGVFTTMGLWLLNVPLALSLGFLAGLLTFVPYIGPTLALLPAFLIALSKSTSTAVYVLILYLGIQTLESYLVTPQIQKRAISLPPGLILAAQVAMGALLGALGIILAMPLSASIFVLIRMVYLEDILGDTGD